MIPTIMKIGFLNLRRDRVAFVMTFVLPPIFFSIFAVIFGATDNGSRNTTIKVVVADDDRSDVSGRFIAALEKEKALELTTAAGSDAARRGVHDGKFAAAILIRNGFASNFGQPNSTDETVELVYDAANPIAHNAVAGLLQAASMRTAPDLLMERGLRAFETFGASLTPQQRNAIDRLRPILRGDGGSTAGGSSQGIIRVRSTDAHEGEAKTQQYSMIAYYAAGLGVMFLLFSSSGASGTLLDEKDNGTLDRLLSTRVSMSELLFGKWFYLTLQGIVQVTVMFLWASVVFHLMLSTPVRLAGTAAMAVTTAAAASAFGLVLATACRTRAQMAGLATIVIMIMSALGGSMVPRFIMPKLMETTALFTFNGWALDGFLKVFWYGDPRATVWQSLVSLFPQLAMLIAMTAVFLTIARILARRWESV
jgi:ABC-2 type transport system permease protein